MGPFKTSIRGRPENDPSSQKLFQKPKPKKGSEEKNRIIKKLNESLKENRKIKMNDTTSRDVTVLMLKVKQLTNRFSLIERKDTEKHVILSRMLKLVSENCRHLLNEKEIDMKDIGILLKRILIIEKEIENAFKEIHQNMETLIGFSSESDSVDPNQNIEQLLTRETSDENILQKTDIVKDSSQGKISDMKDNLVTYPLFVEEIFPSCPSKPVVCPLNSDQNRIFDKNVTSEKSFFNQLLSFWPPKNNKRVISCKNKEPILKKSSLFRPPKFGQPLNIDGNSGIIEKNDTSNSKIDDTFYPETISTISNFFEVKKSSDLKPHRSEKKRRVENLLDLDKRVSTLAFNLIGNHEVDDAFKKQNIEENNRQVFLNNHRKNEKESEKSESHKTKNIGKKLIKNNSVIVERNDFENSEIERSIINKQLENNDNQNLNGFKEENSNKKYDQTAEVKLTKRNKSDFQNLKEEDEKETNKDYGFDDRTTDLKVIKKNKYDYQKLKTLKEEEGSENNKEFENSYEQGEEAKVSNQNKYDSQDLKRVKEEDENERFDEKATDVKFSKNKILENSYERGAEAKVSNKNKYNSQDLKRVKEEDENERFDEKATDVKFSKNKILEVTHKDSETETDSTSSENEVFENIKTHDEVAIQVVIFDESGNRPNFTGDVGRTVSSDIVKSDGKVNKYLIKNEKERKKRCSKGSTGSDFSVVPKFDVGVQFNPPKEVIQTKSVSIMTNFSPTVQQILTTNIMNDSDIQNESSGEKSDSENHMESSTSYDDFLLGPDRRKVDTSNETEYSVIRKFDPKNWRYTDGVFRPPSADVQTLTEPTPKNSRSTQTADVGLINTPEGPVTKVNVFYSKTNLKYILPPGMDHVSLPTETQILKKRALGDKGLAYTTCKTDDDGTLHFSLTYSDGEEEANVCNTTENEKHLNEIKKLWLCSTRKFYKKLKNDFRKQKVRRKKETSICFSTSATDETECEEETSSECEPQETEISDISCSDTEVENDTDTSESKKKPYLSFV